MLEDKITEKRYAFSGNLCYNNTTKMEVCAFIRGKGVPYEQYFIFSDTKSNVRISL